MIRSARLSACAMAALFALTFASSSVGAQQKVLVYTRNYTPDGKGYVHDNIASSVAAIRKMGAEQGFGVDVSDDPASFTDANLKQYAALVFSNSNNEAFATEPQKDAFKRYIQSGGGFVGIHSASGSQRDWPYFWSVLGGKFVVHPKQQKFTVRIADSSQVSTKGIPAQFEWTDEFYFTDNLNPALHPVLVSDRTKLELDGMKGDTATFPNPTPLAWWQRFDGGREYYIALGHNKADYANPILYKLIQNGIVWAMTATPSATPGIEMFLANIPADIRGKRVGLITNHSGIDRFKNTDIDLIAQHKDLKLVALLAPEHGIRGTVMDGETISDETDPKTGVPIHSLYKSEDHGPTPEMLKDVDVLVYDLQEVGGRTWTYVSTMALGMEAAKRKGIPFVVLDRPNPIGGEIVEGALLDSKFKSFVGMYPIPARHGLTVGELATMFNTKFGIGADLRVVKAANWKRSQWMDDTGLPWVNPSPNLRSLAALSSYPGSVYFEGTNITEGRGTDRPFEQVGAPWLNAPEVARTMNEKKLPGIRFEPIAMSVLPTAAKHKGLTIPAIRLVITDRQAYRPVRTSLTLIDEIRRTHPKEFAWTGTIDRLTGSDKVRLAIEGGRLPALLDEWDKEAAAFRESSKAYQLYR